MIYKYLTCSWKVNIDSLVCQTRSILNNGTVYFQLDNDSGLDVIIKPTYANVMASISQNIFTAKIMQ